MHRLLRRQVRKHLGDAVPPELEALLAAVSEAYDQFDADRQILSRSMELSSEELFESNRQLKKQAQHDALILGRLRESIRALRPGGDEDIGDGDILAISSTLQEQIARRNRAEEALQNRERHLKLILDASADAILTVDPEGTITTANPRAVELSGYDTLAGRTLASLSDEPGELEPTLRKAALAGRARLSGWRKRQDGSLYWSEAALSALRNDDGELLGFVEISRDMTARRRDEETLRMTKEAAESASRAKSEFLANMSHEIRTPMNAVIGMTELLEFSALSEEQREMVGTIQSSGKALLSLINDILDLSKIEAGKLAFDNSRFSFRETVESTVGVFGPLVQDRDVRISLYYQASCPEWVRSDETRLRQVLFNLVGNAVKFTPRGEIAISVSARRQTERMRYHVAVRDTGIGIPASRLGAIFDPFSQVESAYNRTSSGTGLGLAISKRLVEALGGEIWVESVEGEGSTFHFTFQTPVTPQGTRPSLPLAEDREPLAGQGSLRVLVVEDNTTNQRVARQFLKRLGIDADVVPNGRDAVDMAREERYELMLMDLQMPVLNGLEATREIRRLPDIEQPYIVALTANAMPEDRARCIDAGMNDYLSKPLAMARLEEAIRQYIDTSAPPTRGSASL